MTVAGCRGAGSVGAVGAGSSRGRPGGEALQVESLGVLSVHYLVVAVPAEQLVHSSLRKVLRIHRLSKSV